MPCCPWRRRWGGGMRVIRPSVRLPTRSTARHSYAPYLVAAWLAVGIGLLVAMKAVGREEWLLKAGQAAYEHPQATKAAE